LTAIKPLILLGLLNKCCTLAPKCF